MSALSTDEKARLRECPFCGGPGASSVRRDDELNRYGEVVCKNCSGSTRGETLHWADNTDAEVASQLNAEIAWNTRALDPELIRLRGEVEAMRDGLLEARRSLQTVKEMSLRGNQRNTILSACEAEQRKIDALLPAAPTTGESHE